MAKIALGTGLAICTRIDWMFKFCEMERLATYECLMERSFFIGLCMTNPTSIVK